MKIAIVGLGLIGASLGRAIVKYTSHEVYGFDISGDVLKRADELSAHTRALSFEDFKSVDIVFFALNPSDTIDEMRRICPLLKDGATVADTCGNKRIICAEMKALKEKYPHLHFIGTHPMAGREYSGIGYSDPNLFKGAYILLVPVSNDLAPVEILKKLSAKIGARDVEICSAERHDEMIAYTSQLAHVVSSCYVQNPHSVGHAGYSAGSFADLTRVARLNPDMWTELFLENRDNLMSCIKDMKKRLDKIYCALEAEDDKALREFLAYGTGCKENADRVSKERNHE